VLRLSTKSAAVTLASLILVIAACASRDARGPFPDTPDPAGARRLAGDWVFAMKVADHEIDGKLHFAYDGTYVTGSFTDMSGAVRQVTEIQASKDRVAWKLADDHGAEQLTGSFSDDGTLSGTMTRSRKRDSEGEGETSGGSENPAGEQPRGGYGHGGGHHHGGGGHGGGRSSGNAKWSAVPAAKADSPGGSG
jgi:hypothetical protein